MNYHHFDTHHEFLKKLNWSELNWIELNNQSLFFAWMAVMEIDQLRLSSSWKHSLADQSLFIDPSARFLSLALLLLFELVLLPRRGTSITFFWVLFWFIFCLISERMESENQAANGQLECLTNLVGSHVQKVSRSLSRNAVWLQLQDRLSRIQKPMANEPISCSRQYFHSNTHSHLLTEALLFSSFFASVTIASIKWTEIVFDSKAFVSFLSRFQSFLYTRWRIGEVVSYRTLTVRFDPDLWHQQNLPYKT